MSRKANIFISIAFCIIVCVVSLFVYCIKLRGVDKDMGELVEKYGYISPYSPSDGSFIYLMEVPYNAEPNKDNSIHVFPPADFSFNYTPFPVKITGVSVMCEETDAFGVAYVNCIQEGKLEYATDLNDTLLEYKTLAEYGLTDAFITSLYALDYNVNLKEYGGTVSDLQVYDLTNLYVITTYSELIDTSAYNELCDMSYKLAGTLNVCNDLITAEKYEDLLSYKSEYESIKSQFYTWCERYKIAWR